METKKEIDYEELVESCKEEITNTRFEMFLWIMACVTIIITGVFAVINRHYNDCFYAGFGLLLCAVILQKLKRHIEDVKMLQNAIETLMKIAKNTLILREKFSKIHKKAEELLREEDEKS